jgi:hypothetical protein
MITRLVAPNGVRPAHVGPAILEKVVHSRGALHQAPGGGRAPIRRGKTGPSRPASLISALDIWLNVEATVSVLAPSMLIEHEPWTP